MNYYLIDHPTTKIFHTNSYEPVPKHFDAVTIPLDGRVTADLNWHPAIKAAEAYVSQGLKLFWKLDLGLFHDLPAVLEDQTQFLSLTLALKHFRDTVWPQFSAHTIGLSLYQGSIDFTGALHEKNIKFARDKAIEYFDLLARQLPADLQTTLLLDASSIKDPLLLIQLLSKDGFEHLHRGMLATILPSFVFGRGTATLSRTYMESKSPKISLGVCETGLTKEIYDTLEQIPFRLISEEHLITEWDGLDYLLICSTLNPSLKRKLLGFIAAGGTVLYFENPLGLPLERKFSERETL